MNNPLRYTDPSGHVSCAGSNWDDGPQCEKKHPGIFSGCSVGYGVFTGRFTCTPDDLNGSLIRHRKSWFNQMLSSADPKLNREFTNLNGILNSFITTGKGAPGSWVSWGDAGILNSVQNGLATLLNEKSSIDTTNPYSVQASNAWYEYFKSFRATGPSNTTLQLWGAAEGLGTNYGKLLAGAHGQSKSFGETVFLLIGDEYRNALKNRQDPATMSGPQWSADLYGWVLNTSSTIGVPYTNIDTGVAPVSLVAYFLLPLEWPTK